MFTDKNLKIMIAGLTLLLVVLIGIELKPKDTEAKEKVAEATIKNEDKIVKKVEKAKEVKETQVIEKEVVEETYNVLGTFKVTQQQEEVLLSTGKGFYVENLDVSYFENGTSNVCKEIRAYEGFVYNKLSSHGLSKHTEFFLALLQKESGCQSSIVNADIAQASESLGLAPNTITDPYESIFAGVNYYAGLVNKYEGQVDARFILQSYNYGEQLVKQAIEEDAEFTISYLIEKSKVYKKIYLPNQVRKEGEWRPVGGEYGDFRYVANLFSIYNK